MSSKRLSPTATLLRNSRLFSMPAPLPRPMNDYMGHVQSNKTSDTSTLPYPIQQAVATTPSALARGDWGLKRALPLRATTKSGTPIFRINAIDTREHITDFESASDLSLTLQKFQELNLPITRQPQRILLSRSEARTSVFESAFDNTDPNVPKWSTDTNVSKSSKKMNQRWKFHGPWVAGMTQGDFDEYLQSHVKHRKEEFLTWLRQERLEELKKDARTNATQEGQTIGEAESKVELSEQDFMEYIQQLRSDPSLGQPITLKIEEFLDLPPLPQRLGSPSSAEDYNSGEMGPPATHPSAGLTYIRSDCFLENHPILGPQARHSPVEARILVAESGSFIKGKRRGKVGVAGIIATTPEQKETRISSNTESLEGEESADYATRNTARRDGSGATLGVHTKGGNRIWVEPTGVLINSRGRIDLKVANAAQAAVDVHTGAYRQQSYQQVERSRPMPSMDLPYPERGQSPRNRSSIVDDISQKYQRRSSRN